MYNTTLKAKFEGKPSPYPVILPDSPRFTIVDVDKAYCKASHKRAADLMNKGLFEAFADIPNDPGSNAKEILSASLNLVIATKTTQRMGYQKHDILVPESKDIEERYWIPENIPVLNDLGEIDFIIHSAKDITEKKVLEKFFEVESQRFQDLYAQAPSCMGMLKGPNHIFELANPLYLNLIGKNDIIGKTVKEVLPELEAQGIFEILDTVYETGQSFSANEMLVKLDRQGTGVLSDTYLNYIYQAYRNHEGTIDGIFFFAIDVTEQVLSRKKIEFSENRFKTLIHEGTDLISIVDENRNYKYLSPAYTSILGIFI